MKQQIEQLIERLEKGVSHCDCPCEHEIYIGDVLERIWQVGGASIHFNSEQCRQLCDTWRWIGFTKSLQEIFDCEWEETNEIGPRVPCEEDCVIPKEPTPHFHHAPIYIPKDKNKLALGKFLLSLNF
ncbi:MAG: hypothetical protein V3T43_06225 [Nitrosomonadaceae bacterium]